MKIEVRDVRDGHALQVAGCGYPVLAFVVVVQAPVIRNDAAYNTPSKA